MALEFALVALPFFTFMLFIFELCFAMFTHEVLDSALHLAARDVQTGTTQNVPDGTTFVNNKVCPKMGGLLPCSTSNLFVKIQKLPIGADYYSYTTGTLPVSNGVLNLSGYGTGNFCNTGPTQLVLISAIYIGPTFVAQLLTSAFSVKYNGIYYHPTMATTGVVTEAYTPNPTNGAAAAAPCT